MCAGKVHFKNSLLNNGLNAIFLINCLNVDLKSGWNFLTTLRTYTNILALKINCVKKCYFD